MPFSTPKVQGFALFDAGGNAIPVESLSVLRNDDGGIRQAHVAFMVRDVPALGYAVYHAVPNAPGPEITPTHIHNSTREDHATIENEFYRASFNLWTGEMTSLVLKENNWEVLAKAGNVVAREYDGGDFWELYGTLNGVRFTAMKRAVLLPGQTIRNGAVTSWVATEKQLRVRSFRSSASSIHSAKTSSQLASASTAGSIG